ncbi:unnamed protein product [Amoebophrya sp. A25]|nr:unnamed protein product [Amoebophrya sp. A25]|eukprot:GSA25T00004586001.1
MHTHLRGHQGCLGLFPSICCRCSTYAGAALIRISGLPSRPCSTRAVTQVVASAQTLRFSFSALLRFLSTTTTSTRSLLATTSSSSVTSMSSSSLRVALLQLPVSPTGYADGSNQGNAEEAVQAVLGEQDRDRSKKLDLVLLPEVWNGPYVASGFPAYAEMIGDVGTIPSATSCSSALPPKQAELPDVEAPEKGKGEQLQKNILKSSLSGLSVLAKEHSVTIVAGSIPERDEAGRIYNSSVVLSPVDGSIVAKHRKVHLFDIDIPGKITFKESETLTGGTEVTTFGIQQSTSANSESGDDKREQYLNLLQAGLLICYDLRFPELSLLARKRGAQVLCVPAAFNTVTGPKHWSLVMRARAIDTQCYVLACSPARDTANPKGYQAWGHSMIVSPWGEILAELDEKPGRIVFDLDMNEVAEARAGIPVGMQRRHDVYRLEEVATTAANATSSKF